MAPAVADRARAQSAHAARARGSARNATTGTRSRARTTARGRHEREARPRPSSKAVARWPSRQRRCPPRCRRRRCPGPAGSPTSGSGASARDSPSLHRSWGRRAPRSGTRGPPAARASRAAMSRRPPGRPGSAARAGSPHRSGGARRRRRSSRAASAVSTGARARNCCGVTASCSVIAIARATSARYSRSSSIPRAARASAERHASRRFPGRGATRG